MRILLAVGLAVVLVCVGLAQTPGPGMPVTTLGVGPASGEAAIGGRVTDAQTGRPLVKASVSLAPAEQPTSKTTTTDELGRFEFVGLTPGTYQIFGRAPGYLVWAYRQQVYGGPSVSVSVMAGEVADYVDVALPREAVLSGRIYDDRGEPAPSIEVQVMSERPIGGRMQLTHRGRATTDDTGTYRVGGLTSGEYVINARRTPGAGPGDADVDGRRLLETSFYPGTPRITEAQRVLVDEGVQLFGIDFALAAEATYEIAGTVLDADGLPYADASITIMQRVGSSRFGRSGDPVGANGVFRLTGVTPGDYDLMVGSHLQPDRGRVSRTVSVEDQNLVGLQLVARRGVTLVGRIVTDEGGSVPFGTADLRFRQGGEPRQNLLLGDSVMIRPGEHQIRQDGTFTLRHVIGEQRLWLSGLPSGWILKSLTLDGEDIADRSLDFGENATRRLEVVVTNKISEISGTVTDRSGQAADVMVVIFPEDDTRWTYPSRYIQATRGDRDGRYRIDDLPRGDYLAVAVSFLGWGAWTDLEVLNRLRPYAQRVSLGEGAGQILDLTLSSWRP